MLEDETDQPANQALGLNLVAMNLSSEHGMELFARLDTITIKKEVNYYNMRLNEIPIGQVHMNGCGSIYT